MSFTSLPTVIVIIGISAVLVACGGGGSAGGGSPAQTSAASSPTTAPVASTVIFTPAATDATSLKSDPSCPYNLALLTLQIKSALTLYLMINGI